MQAFLDKLSELAGTYGPGVIAAIATLVIGWIIARILTGVVRRLMHRANIDPTLIGFIGNLTYLALMTMIVIAAIGKLGVETASFVVVIGAAGLAIGFALQGSLANFASGVLLIIFRPFRIGDYVEAGGTAGTIEEIKVFATTFKTPDNKVVVVPNSAVTGGNITNYSAKETRRVDLVFGIGYGDDLKKAKRILSEILEKDSRVLTDPPATIAVLELADSSVNIAVRPWVKSADYWDVYFELTEAVKLAFDAEGISIPFPQQDVHMHSAA